jgi:serine/threonine protein kinase
MENLKKVSEERLKELINPDHEVMNYQSVIKIDKFGKRKIDRIVVLTTHQILIVYEGGMELEIKSMLDIKYLDYVIKSMHVNSPNEVMLCFNNRQRSCMHLILAEDLEEFFDLLKLRWININPKKSLKVYGVPEASLVQYHQKATKGYKFENLPPDEMRLRDDEVVSQEEFENLKRSESTNDDSMDFNFEGSRSETEGESEKKQGKKGVSKEILNDMRQSVLVSMANEDSEDKLKNGPSLEDFNILVVLGKGTFGKVFLAESKINSQLYAIKVIRKDILIEYNQIKNTKLEKDIMFKCQHQFLVGMEYLFMSNLRLFFVMPFVQGGELYRFFKSKKRFKESEVKFYAVQIALALGYLHKKGIVHRDLKLENILVAQDGYLKIIDFGLAKLMDQGSVTKTYCGTPEYLAPEMIAQTGHNFGIDWWALGILIYEMRIGVTPFFNKNKNMLFAKIQKSKVIFPDKAKYGLEYSDEFVDIVQKLLDKNPNQRLGAKDDVMEVLNHPWFSDVNVKNIEAQKVTPPLKPDLSKDQVDFKYFNLRQQNTMESFLPPERVAKVQSQNHKFADFDKEM